MKNPISLDKLEKTIISLSSAEIAHNMLRVNQKFSSFKYEEYRFSSYFLLT